MDTLWIPYGYPMDTLWIKIALKNTEKMPELDFL
jgi:hypothetical protein